MGYVNWCLKVIVNKLFKEIFYTTFMRNRKNNQNINYVFFCKNFHKIVH